MAYIDHACIDCQTVRKVRKDKLAKGLQTRCRKCQALFSTESRSKAMKEYAKSFKGIHGGAGCQERGDVFGICKCCRKDYEKKSAGDDGFCSDACRKSGMDSNTPRLLDSIKKDFLYGRLALKNNSIISPKKTNRHWEQMEIELSTQ